MTNLQKSEIVRLRKDGVSYNEIADALGLQANTVKTFCWRNKDLLGDAPEETVVDENNDACNHCGEKLEQRPKAKPRRFCCDACRLAWWSKNRSRMKRKAVYSLVCSHCQKKFNSYGNKGRKFCCHECYIASRFKKAVAVE